MKILYLLFFFLFSIYCFGQNEHKSLREGNRAYRSGNYTDAELHYRDAGSESTKGIYNLGNSLHAQDRLEEAVKHFERAVVQSDDPEIRKNALFNLGNAQYQLGAFDKSVEAYRQLLSESPDDKEALENLWKAWSQLQKQQPPPEQQQSDQSEEQEEQDPQEDQPPQQEPQPDNQSELEETEVTPPEKEPLEELNEEDAEELLRIAEEEDQKVQEKLKKQSGQRKPKKNW